jgi:hypothetical protein
MLIGGLFSFSLLISLRAFVLDFCLAVKLSELSDSNSSFWFPLKTAKVFGLLESRDLDFGWYSELSSSECGLRFPDVLESTLICDWTLSLVCSLWVTAIARLLY